MCTDGLTKQRFFDSRCRSNWKLMCHLSSPQPDENFLNTIYTIGVCVSAAYQTFRQNRHIRPIVKLTFPCHLELDRSQIEIPSLVENARNCCRNLEAFKAGFFSTFLQKLICEKNSKPFLSKNSR